MFLNVLRILLIFSNVLAYIIEYTDANFTKNLDQHNLAFILFYKSQCIFCKQFRPIFEKIGQTLEKDSIQVILVKVNCDANDVTCRDYHIKKYPTLKVISNGYDIEDYREPRDERNLVTFIKDLDYQYNVKPLSRNDRDVTFAKL